MKRLFILFFAALVSVSAAAQAQKQPKTSATAFRLAALDGRQWIAPKGDGRTTVIAYWDSACPPCLVELASLPQLARANPTIRFIAAGLEPRDVQRRTLARFQVTGIELAIATPATVRRFGNQRGMLPFTTFHRLNGGMCAQLLGALTQTSLSQRISQCSL